MLLALTGGLLGLANGVRHAMEPDHLAAVSTLVAEQRTMRASVSFAAIWGLGHASVLVAVGGLLVLLDCRMPPMLANAAELGVAVMLVGLGVRALLRARRPHRHDGSHDASAASLRRPLAVGLVHGLAGSGALTALVVATGRSPASALAFMALYGAGAMLGMSALAGALRLPLARIAATGRGASMLLAVSGATSVVIGVAWAAVLFT
jgi:hypothetical protein